MFEINFGKEKVLISLSSMVKEDSPLILMVNNLVNRFDASTVITYDRNDRQPNDIELISNAIIKMSRYSDNEFLFNIVEGEGIPKVCSPIDKDYFDYNEGFEYSENETELLKLVPNVKYKYELAIDPETDLVTTEELIADLIEYCITSKIPKEDEDEVL